MDAAILPVKSLLRAKARLGEAFSPEERALIARALFDDALALCRETSFLQWWVVSDDPIVRQEATEAGTHTVTDTGAGLNDALRVALDAVTEAGAESVLILPSDLPLARAQDIHDIVDTGATSDVVVVPSDRDGGTNALHLRPPGIMAPRFGEGSLRSHLDEADARGLRCSMLVLPRLGLDLDIEQDAIELLAAHDGRGNTIDALRAFRSRSAT